MYLTSCTIELTDRHLSSHVSNQSKYISMKVFMNITNVGNKSKLPNQQQPMSFIYEPLSQISALVQILFLYALKIF